MVQLNSDYSVDISRFQRYLAARYFIDHTKVKAHVDSRFMAVTRIVSMVQNC